MKPGSILDINITDAEYAFLIELVNARRITLIDSDELAAEEARKCKALTDKLSRYRYANPS